MTTLVGLTTTELATTELAKVFATTPVKYQVGYLIHFQKDDHEFDQLLDAVKYALEKSHLCPFGVWTSQKDGSELMAIVYQDEIFTK